MLAEIKGARQIPGEGFRRWFADEYFDLIVWYKDAKSPVTALKGFQLCYDKSGRERALTWTREHGFQHNRIDSGEVPGHAKMSPVIIADGDFRADAVAELFRREAASIDPHLAGFVHSKIKAYQGKPRDARRRRSRRS